MTSEILLKVRRGKVEVRRQGYVRVGEETPGSFSRAAVDACFKPSTAPWRQAWRTIADFNSD